MALVTQVKRILACRVCACVCLLSRWDDERRGVVSPHSGPYICLLPLAVQRSLMLSMTRSLTFSLFLAVLYLFSLSFFFLLPSFSLSLFNIVLKSIKRY